MKIGRNDPCPCGSGKKYKKCCMNNNIIQFPGVSTSETPPAQTNNHLFNSFPEEEEKQTLYHEFCNQLDPGDPIPSFEEFLHTMDDTKGFLSTLGLNETTMMNCGSQEELQQLISERIDSYNQDIDEQDLDYFTDQLDQLVSEGIMHADSLVEINPKTNLRLIKNAPIMIMLQILLQIAGSAGGTLSILEEDESSHLPDWILQWIEQCKRRLKAPFTTLDSNHNHLFLYFLAITNSVAEELELLILKDSQLNLSDKGQNFSEGKDARKIYIETLSFLSEEIDWFYQDDYPEEIGRMWATFGISLFLIALQDEELPINWLQLFDQSSEIMEWDKISDMSEDDQIDAFEDRFLKCYAYLSGFLIPKELSDDMETEYYSTKLYHQLFSWKIIKNCQ